MSPDVRTTLTCLSEKPPLNPCLSHASAVRDLVDNPSPSRLTVVAPVRHVMLPTMWVVCYSTSWCWRHRMCVSSGALCVRLCWIPCGRYVNAVAGCRGIQDIKYYTVHTSGYIQHFTLYIYVRLFTHKLYTSPRPEDW